MTNRFYNLMESLDGNIARRKQAERLMPQLPESMQPRVAEIIELMRQLEELDEYVLDFLIPGADAEGYAQAKAEQTVWLANIQARIEQLAKDYDVD